MLDTAQTMQHVAELLWQSRSAIALTGAGISVPSGIPDFRSPGGLWSRYDIMEYATLDAFLSRPDRVWNLFRDLMETVERALPNPAHVALAKAEQMGLVKQVITQNIDGLHQRAGSTAVAEFHGSCDQMSCLRCRSRFPSSQFREDLHKEVFRVPSCDCGFPLKPDIVLFGESIPQQVLTSSLEAAERADVILVIGTSATVAPASMLPALVRQKGGVVIEMNLEETDLSHRAHHRVLGDVAHTLPTLVRWLKELSESSKA
jgi:NAD-dependent deacetylase